MAPTTADSVCDGSSKQLERNAPDTGYLGPFAELDIVLEEQIRTVWGYFDFKSRPCFTPTILADILEMQRRIPLAFEGGNAPFDFHVVGSRAPGVFCLGGDLELFAAKAEERNLDAMRQYARRAALAVYQNAIAFGQPVVTIALVQGEALGGGFETALSCDVIVAERSSKFGLPEVLFNLFPGMGAFSFLSRRLDGTRARKMVQSGSIYSAQELADMGIVDIVADDGEGELAVRDYIAKNRRRHNALQASFRANRRAQNLTFDEMRDVVDIWAEAAMHLTDFDLRLMRRLVGAQDKSRTKANLARTVPAE